MADITAASIAAKNPYITSQANNPANPGFPVNSNRDNYAANPNIPADMNNPANPGYFINSARF